MKMQRNGKTFSGVDEQFSVTVPAGSTYKQALRILFFAYHAKLKEWNKRMNELRVMELKQSTSYHTFLKECKGEHEAFTDDIDALDLELPSNMFGQPQKGLTDELAMKLRKATMEKVVKEARQARQAKKNERRARQNQRKTKLNPKEMLTMQVKEYLRRSNKIRRNRPAKRKASTTKLTRSCYKPTA